MKEIGGYFELGGFKNEPYQTGAIALNTATNAVIYLIKAKGIKKMYLPYYLCNCLDKIKDFCSVEYYKINKDFTPNFNKKLEKNEYLYFVNYYGMFDNDFIIYIKDKFRNIIVDNVQAFFQNPIESVDTIYSCRKFFGVPDGAYLYSNKQLEEEIPTDKSLKHFSHLLGRLEDGANIHFEEYRNNEKHLIESRLEYMSKTSELIMNAENYEKISEIRTNNFKYLNKYLGCLNGIKVKNIIGAYMYPFYSKNPAKLKEKLISNKIYVPTLWPNVLEQNKDEIGYDYALNIIPLPCDQRYGEVDMKKIIKIIKGENIYE